MLHHRATIHGRQILLESSLPKEKENENEKGGEKSEKKPSKAALSQIKIKGKSPQGKKTVFNND